jgi:hypothetical protein
MKPLMLALALLVPTFARAEAALDGKAYTVEMGEKGKSDAKPETLDFKAGKFHSDACDQYGFTAAPYSAKGGEWQADTSSAKEGKMRWKGKVQGDAISGTAVWSKPGQKDIEYWFKGSLKK